MINLVNLLPEQLEQFFQTLGEPSFRAKQLLRWIHHDGVTDFQQMSNFSKSLREKLTSSAVIQFPEIIIDKSASDGTRKWLLQLESGGAIEAVFIPDGDRGTLCVSSQVGCALNCSFCSTGKQGFNRNLTLGEIIGQLWLARKMLADNGVKAHRPITNVVMMGMGEPLLNYQPVLAAIRLMLDDQAYGLSKYRVTLSTSGVIPQMLQLKQDVDCALAVSLHAPNDALRNELVPLNKKYPLAELMRVCREYFPNEKREILFEYVMLKGINDQFDHADELIDLLKGLNCKVNLIPFNPFQGTQYTTSSLAQIEAFQRRLMKGGIATWVRRTRGEDIDAACGQLAGQFQDRTGRHQRWQKTGKLVVDKS